MNRLHVLSLIVAVAAAGAPSWAQAAAIETYTLYRTSALDATARMHVATFDTDEGSAYNLENCARAQTLFQRQAGVKVRFWCEQGIYRAKGQAPEAKLSKQFTGGEDAPITCSPSASKLTRGDKVQSTDYQCGR